MTRVAVGVRRDVLRCPLCDHHAAARPALGTHVNDPVRRLDHVEIVLDDDDRIALVDKAIDDAEQLADVLEMQPGGWLVEDVHRATGRPLLQFGRQLHTLRLSAGQRRRRLTQPHVAVEVNLDVIPRAEHRDKILSDGDRVEVVTLVGGG